MVTCRRGFIFYVDLSAVSTFCIAAAFGDESIGRFYRLYLWLVGWADYVGLFSGFDRIGAVKRLYSKWYAGKCLWQ